MGDLLILSSVSLFWDTGKKPQDSMRHSLKTTEIARSIPVQARRLKPRERKRLIQAQRVNLYPKQNLNPFLYILHSLLVH